MSSNVDPITLIQTGQLPFILIVGTLLSWPVALLLLARYKRSVLRQMSKSLSAKPIISAEGIQSMLAPIAGGQNHLHESIGRTKNRFVSTTMLYSVFYGLCVALATLLSDKIAVAPLKLSLLTAIYGWPGVLLLSLLYFPDFASRRSIAAVYSGIVVTLSMGALFTSPDLTAQQLLILWVISNVPASILIYFFINRQIRGAGVMVMFFLVLCVTGAVLMLGLAGAIPSYMLLLNKLGAMLKLNGATVFTLIPLSGILLFAIIGWFALQQVGKLYVQKKMNDNSLVTDGVMLLFALAQTLTLAFENSYWGFSGILIFIAWKIVAYALERMMKTKNGQPVNLLILRVFRLGKKSERLFDRLAADWRYIGPVQLIAGPDLVTSTIEPHEIISFLRGRLSRLFCTSEIDITTRIAGLDLKPDHDSRYRVNEFFCHDTTWQTVLERLLSRTHAALLDLRSFTKLNRGCIYEIETLLKTVSLERFVIMTDSSTDHTYLSAVLGEFMRALPQGSVNYQKKAPEPLPIDFVDRKTVKKLFSALVSAATTVRQ